MCETSVKYETEPTEHLQSIQGNVLMMMKCVCAQMVVLGCPNPVSLGRFSMSVAIRLSDVVCCNSDKTLSLH